MIPAIDARALVRARSGVKRALASRLHRRALTVAPAQPLVSFSFDDAPRSAFDTGARVLERHGLRGTYYVSLGLLGQPGPSGCLGRVEELRAAVAAGHELGCHTHDHLDAQALQRLLPGQRFETFAYPKSGAVAAVKPALARRFLACRHGGQHGNAGLVDRDLLAACFLDRQQHADLSFLRHLLEDNARRRGWLIFATHDVALHPSPWGCTPAFLEAVVRHALRTGSRILPVREALRAAAPSQLA
jgi:hypothetical protein